MSSLSMSNLPNLNRNLEKHDLEKYDLEKYRASKDAIPQMVMHHRRDSSGTGSAPDEIHLDRADSLRSL